MSKKAFDKFAEGLHEALAIARGEQSRPSCTFRRRSTCGHPRAHRAVAGRLRHGVRFHHQPDQGLGAGPRPSARRCAAYLLIIERDARSVLELLRKAREEGGARGMVMAGLDPPILRPASSARLKMWRPHARDARFAALLTIMPGDAATSRC